MTTLPAAKATSVTASSFWEGSITRPPRRTKSKAIVISECDCEGSSGSTSIGQIAHALDDTGAITAPFERPESRMPNVSKFRASEADRAPPASRVLSLRRVREGAENSRPRADALVETLQVVFFVRRMDVVVVQAKAHQHRVEPERALEVGDDRDRCAGTHQHGFLAPLFGQRAPSGDQRLHVPVQRDRGRAGVVAEFGGAIFRQPRRDVVAKGFSNFAGILPHHQAERYFCGSFRRNHGL